MRLAAGATAVALALVAEAAIVPAPYVRASALPDRPPLAHTGGFGEPTCAACHFDGPLNDRDGSLTITGVPWRYQSGDVYRISVRLARKGLSNGGFELSARFAGGVGGGSQAGRLSPLDDRVNVADTTRAGGSPIMYARHTLAGTRPWQVDTLEWTLNWTAPAVGGGAVIFNVAANAGNDDNSPLGDFIYTSGTTSSASTIRSRNR